MHKPAEIRCWPGLHAPQLPVQSTIWGPRWTKRTSTGGPIRLFGYIHTISKRFVSFMPWQVGAVLPPAVTSSTEEVPLPVRISFPTHYTASLQTAAFFSSLRRDSRCNSGGCKCREYDIHLPCDIQRETVVRSITS